MDADISDVELLKNLGLTLKESEAKAIVSRYSREDEGRRIFDERRFLEDLGKELTSLKSSQAARQFDLYRPKILEDHEAVLQKKRTGKIPGKERVESRQLSYYERILVFIKEAINAKSVTMRGENFLKNSFRLLSENKSPYLTPKLLKSGCLYRLNLSLTDKQISVIFDKLDPKGTGTILTKDFIEEMAAAGDDDSKYRSNTLEIPISKRRNLTTQTESKSWVLNQSARVSYDHRFSGLVPPEKETSLYVPSLFDLEVKIYDKIVERTSRGANTVQLLVKLFSDDREKHERKGISRDQMRFTLWKTFQLNVAEDDIEKLYQKYDPDHTGYISLEAFIQAIIGQHSTSEPMLDDPADASEEKMKRVRDGDNSRTILHDRGLKEFLRYLRKKFRDLVNREGRAPHYLLHSSGRMSAEQARSFLEQKLGVVVSDELMEELAYIYQTKGLFDMKLLLRDAMALEGDGMLGKVPNILSNNIVQCDTLPATMRGVRTTPEELSRVLAEKMGERMDSDHPMSSLHKLFRSPDAPAHENVKFFNKHTLRTVLSRLDIFVSEEDFERFFARHHTRGDGLIETRKFLHHLFPQDNHEQNPFTPKDVSHFTEEVDVAKILGTMSGTRRRPVSQLIGPANIRFLTDNTGKTTNGVDGSVLLNTLKGLSVSSAGENHTFAGTEAVSNETRKPSRPQTAPPSSKLTQSPRKGHTVQPGRVQEEEDGYSGNSNQLRPQVPQTDTKGKNPRMARGHFHDTLKANQEDSMAGERASAAYANANANADADAGAPRDPELWSEFKRDFHGDDGADPFEGINWDEVAQRNPYDTLHDREGMYNEEEDDMRRAAAPPRTSRSAGAVEGAGVGAGRGRKHRTRRDAEYEDDNGRPAEYTFDKDGHFDFEGFKRSLAKDTKKPINTLTLNKKNPGTFGTTPREGRSAPLRKAISKRAVVNHYKKWKGTDPMHPLLLHRYKVANEKIVTAHEAYGLFFHKLMRVTRDDNKMLAKHKAKAAAEAAELAALRAKAGLAKQSIKL